MLLATSREARRGGGEALRGWREVAGGVQSLKKSLTSTISTSSSVVEASTWATSTGRGLLSFSRSSSSSSSSSSSGGSCSSASFSTSGREDEDGENERGGQLEVAGRGRGFEKNPKKTGFFFAVGSRALGVPKRPFSSSSTSSFASITSAMIEEENKQRERRAKKASGLDFASRLLPLPLTPLPLPPPPPPPRLHFSHFVLLHARHLSSDESIDRPSPSSSPHPTTTATSIAQALRLPRNSLKKLDLSDGSADLRCVNLLCERVGKSCVCRLSLALSRVAERQGGSLTELSLARNGIEELPGGVWEFFGEGGEGESEKSKPKFEALRRIDLSGNEGLKQVSGIERGEAMPALRELLVDRGVVVVVDKEEEESGGEVVEVVEV